MKFSIKKLFEKEKWAVIKTYEVDVVDDDNIKVGKLFLHLSESNKGGRKIEPFSTYIFRDIDASMRRTVIYNNTIHRWLSGRNDPEIPKYSDIGEEDTVNYLRGKV